MHKYGKYKQDTMNMRTEQQNRVITPQKLVKINLTGMTPTQEIATLGEAEKETKIIMT